jgi:hypothetical protein
MAVLYSKGVHGSEMDGIMTQSPKNASKMISIHFFSMNIYLREREKVLFTNKH